MDLKKIFDENGITNPVRNSTAVERTMENPIKESYLEGKLIELFDNFYGQKRSKFDLGLYNTFLEALDSKKYNTYDIEGDIPRLCEIARFYQHIHNNLNNFGFTGLFVSAAINKAADGRNEINLRLTSPLDHILYKSSDKKSIISGKAGDHLGQYSKNCNITAEEAGDDAGDSMRNVVIYVKKAGDNLGVYSQNCNITAEEARDYAGVGMTGGILDIKKAGDYLGASARNCKITADESKDSAGCRMKNVSLDIKKARDYLGASARNCKIISENTRHYAGWQMTGGILEIKQAGDYLGELSENCQITAEESGDHAGWSMKKGTLNVKKAGKHFGKFSHKTILVLNGHKKGFLWKVLN